MAAGHAKAADADPTGPGVAKASTVEEVIVTANKREQSIYSVAAAVNVISSSTLEAQGMNTLTDAADLIPGLSSFSRGATGTNQFILRGITSGSQQTSPTVGFYVNDTPFSFSIPVGGGSGILQPDIDPALVERIEVLRGPQGTLYGASTLGGLIKYITRKPDPDHFDGAVSTGITTVEGGGVGYITRGSVNLPIVTDKVALQVSAFGRHDPGYITNTQLDERDVNYTDAYGGRVALGVYPTNNLKIVLSGLWQQNNVNATSDVNLNQSTLIPIAGDLTQQSGVNDSFNSDYKLADLELNWSFNGYTFTSSTSYADVDLKALFDFTTLLPADFLGSSLVTGPQNLHYKKFTEEDRIASPDHGFFQWAVGAYFTKEDVNAASTINLYNTGGSPNPIPIISAADTLAHYQEEAVFGNLIFNFTSRWNVTAGGRFSHNNINDDVYQGGLLAGTALNSPALTVGHSSASVGTFLVSTNYKITETESVYARVASGYRPGGPIEANPFVPPDLSVPTQYKPDSVVDYEIGARGSWFDGKVKADADLFYIDWKNIQLPFIVDGLRELSNGSGAKSEGVEVEGQVHPVAGLTLAANAAYTDARLTANAPLVYGFTGDRLPYVPTWTGSLLADYEHAIGAGLDGDLGVTLHGESSRNIALSPADPTFAHLAGFTTLDLRAGFMRGRYAFNLYVRNVLDKRAYVSGNFPGFVPIQPMTFGAIVSASF
jgi:outer membrane receptor protein involved in Fe transport